MDQPTTSRRDLLRGVACLGASAGLATLPTRAAFASTAGTGNVLVVVWLRGGIDGLSAVAPLDEAAFVDARREIALTPDAGLPLDDRFGLHPAMAPLREWWDDQRLAVVHAVGNPVPTRSHFAAMDELERGTPGSMELTSGWLGRWLESAAAVTASPFRAVGIGTMLPASLRGHDPALAMPSAEAFDLDVAPAHRDALATTLAALHAAADDPLAAEGRRTLDAIAALADSPVRSLAPTDGYPPSPLGRALAEVARLVRADIGLEVATVDGGGWDTHAAMGSVEQGTMRDQLADLATSLAAFAADLEAAGRLDRVTLVTMSEFGRRVQANASGGTDHGRATVSFVLGGGVAGGRVHGDWPGTDPEDLEAVGGDAARGDLAVTTDWRDLLAEVLAARLRPADLAAVFPGHATRALGVVG